MSSSSRNGGGVWVPVGRIEEPRPLGGGICIGMNNIILSIGLLISI